MSSLYIHNIRKILIPHGGGRWVESQSISIAPYKRHKQLMAEILTLGYLLACTETGCLQEEKFVLEFPTSISQCPQE